MPPTKPKTYPSPDEVRRVSVRQISRETGLSRKKVANWLRQNSWWTNAQPIGRPPTYDARIIDVLNALEGHQHRTVTDLGADWLSEYLNSGGRPHA